MADLPAYKDQNHRTNKLRPNLKCWGCGKLGVTGKHWGQWCFDCNVKRIDRINGNFSAFAQSIGVKPS
ncbi:MAG: hypothetical protein J0G33_02880 [Afipia felis]|nr:hypothetical protein [Afipia felis]